MNPVQFLVTPIVLMCTVVLSAVVLGQFTARYSFLGAASDGHGPWDSLIQSGSPLSGTTLGGGSGSVSVSRALSALVMSGRLR